MARFLGFGNGSDGVLSVAGSSTHSPTDSSCSGTSGTNSLTATNISFAAGQRVLIHQSRGTGVGVYEDNAIASYTAGTITTVHQLENTYIDSGSSQAQVIVMPQYSGINITGTLTAKTWNSDVGGILPLLCSGSATIDGTITADGDAAGYDARTDNGVGIGYSGGDGKPATSTEVGGAAQCGEGTVGAAANQTGSNGNGGGGANAASAAESRAAGAGGGHGTAGANGTGARAGSTAGTGGLAVGQASLTSCFFGGSGGGAATDGNGDVGAGGGGGGIIMIFGIKITVNPSTGYVYSRGGAGGYGSFSGGGGGAGGTILLRGQSVSMGTSRGLATGGAGGGHSEGAYLGAFDGGAGGVGRIRIESCSVSGTTSPTASVSTGGHDWCAILGGMI